MLLLQGFAESIAETSYSFEDLDLGTHTAGVEAVYTTGVSEMITVGFELTPPPTYTVTLTVVGGDDGATPIEGATVTINNDEQTTDTDGVVAFSDLLNGTYAYTATMDNYYNATGSIVVDGADVEESIVLTPITGIDSELFSKLKVYPNPFSNKISITHADRVNRVIITNVVGQRVMDITLNGNKEIGTSELGSGIYLITLEGLNGERIVRKMIKR